MNIGYQSIKHANGALDRDFVAALAGCFGLSAFIETGTYLGDTVANMADLFERIVSVELSTEFAALAQRRFAKQPHIAIVEADSTKGLAEAFVKIGDRPALIWLDAHYSGGGTAKGQANSPISVEVAAILDYKNRNDVILIDDLRYFWRAEAGFLTHEALSGYPTAGDVVAQLNGDGHRYDCFAVSDALLAIPVTFAGAYSPSSVLCALTTSRIGCTEPAEIARVEATIGNAAGPEGDALTTIPDYLVGQSDYGLGGHYFYWRGLVRLVRGDQTGSRADASIAQKAGVVPHGSTLERFDG